MKILMTSHYTLPHRGGIEVIIEKLSSSFVQQDHEVKIIASKIGGATNQYLLRREFLGVKSFDPLKRVGVHYPIFSPELVPAMFHAVRWADIVHVQGMLYQNSILGLLLARCMRRPTILTEHAGFVQYSQTFFNLVQKIAIATIGRISLALSDVIIVPDTIVREILVKTIRVRPEKIIQIPLGVDTGIFHPISLEEKQRLRLELGWDNRPKVLFTGNFVARKRIELLVGSLSKKFDIVLCGEGTPTFSLPKGVIVYPAMGHEQLVKIYQAADVFVVPSSVETFSIVSYEAMASGLPVVMTEDLAHLTIKLSGLVKFVQPNISDLQQTINILLDDPDQRLRIGLASAKWVEKNFSWQTTVKKHLDLYRNLLEDTRFLSMNE